MNEKKEVKYSDQLVTQVIKEVDDFPGLTIQLSDRSSFCMYQCIQDSITHQNKQFLEPLSAESIAEGITRDFYDIVTPMVETAISNIDLDTNDLETYCDNPNYIAHDYLATIILRNFLKQTNQGEVINEHEYNFIDDGNLFVRFIEEKNRTDSGDLFKRVLPQNIIVTDPSSESLEQTTYIEKDVMIQSELRKMSNWSNVDLVTKLGRTGSNDDIPYYELFYRYGELNRETLGMVRKEMEGVEYKKKDGDDNDYIQSLVIVARAKKGAKLDDGQETQGILVFAEELKPKTYKITNKLKIKRYKPVEMVRLGRFNGRLWGEGYREIGRTYQNRANEIANQLKDAMEVASKMVFWSSDDDISGKNILSSIRNGQILKAKDLALLNNVFPSLSLYAEEWNKNLNECEKALKAFEVASGESLPSSTSATAVSVQNNAVGKYFNFKREKFGLFLSKIYKRWVIPELLKNMDEKETIELVGDPSFIEDILDAYTNGWLLDNLKDIALQMAQNPDTAVPTKEAMEELKDMKKKELMQQPKLYMEAFKDFFKDVEFYVGLNLTGEPFNKQAKVSNALQMLNFELNPALMNNPEAQDTIKWVKKMLGLPVKKYQAPTQSPNQMPNPTNPVNPSDLSMKEQPLEQV
jgi:hypothetical protein